MEAATIPAPGAKTGLRLYEHTELLEAVHALLIESGGVLTPEVEALLNTASEGFAEKAERVALKVRELEAEAKAVKEEADRLAARARALSAGSRGLKDYLHNQCVRARRAEIKGKLVTIRVQNSPLSAVCTLPADILAERAKRPEYAQFITEVPVSYKLNARAAIEAVGNGVQLPDGIETKQSTHVRIY